MWQVYENFKTEVVGSQKKDMPSRGLNYKQSHEVVESERKLKELVDFQRKKIKVVIWGRH